MQNITRIGRIFHVRVAVPCDLRLYIDQREIKTSLKTSQKSLAKKLARPIISNIQQQFTTLRLIIQMKAPTLEAVAIFKLRHPTGNPLTAAAAGEPSLNNSGWKPVDELLLIQTHLDLGFVADEHGHFDIYSAMQTPKVAAPVQSPVAPLAPAPKVAAPAQSPKHELMITKAIELYLEHCRKPADPIHYKARAECTMGVEIASTKHLLEWVGTNNITAVEVAKKDFKEFSRFFITGKGNKTTSVRTWLNALTRFFKFLHEFGYIDEPPEIVFPKLQGMDKVKTANLAYSGEILQQIFDYVADHRPKSRRDRITQVELAYFLLMLLYTGFRKSEGRDTADNIKTYGKIPVFVQEELTKDVVTSIRWIPLHRVLIQCGFLDFVEKCKGEVFIKNESTYRTPFARIRAALGYTTPREYTFHSFRATFDSNLVGIVEDSTRRIFMGHALTGQDKTYVQQLADRADFYRTQINKLSYPVKFDKLKEYLKSELALLY